MKFEFKNGSAVESIENTGVGNNIRGKRADYIIYQDFNLKWHQKVYLEIYAKIIGLLARFGYVKRR